MSGLEVIGGISAVIGILDASIKVWSSAKKDLKLSSTFETVADRLPIIRDTLQTCHEHFERTPSLPADVTESLSSTVKGCEAKAEKLRTIFAETIPGENNRWYERYRMVARRLGKGSRVEELMTAITEDAQHLVNYHTVKSANPNLYSQLEAIVQEMQSLEPSLPIEEASSQTFNAYGGNQNVSTGNSTQYNSSNTGSGTTHNYGGIAGNPVFNFGTILSTSRTEFKGAYAHASLHPVSAYVARPEIEQKLQAQFPIQTSNGVRTAVVWGLGGVGKSQLVLNFVKEQRQQYQAVFWIQAGRTETIQRDYIQIYKQINQHIAQYYGSVTVEDAISGVKTWLQQQERRCLWIMDSADDVEDKDSESFIDLGHYLPEAPQLDRIITTRSSRIADMATESAITVGEMTAAEAIQLFKISARVEHASQEAEHEVQSIVEKLGYLALAIILAGSYVRETPGLSTNLRQFRMDYDSNRARLLSHTANPIVHQYGESVLSTWEISIKAVRDSSPIAANMISLLSFLNFNDIFIGLFKAPSEARVKSEARGAGGVLADFRLDKVGDKVKSKFSSLHTKRESTSSFRHFERDRWRHLLSSTQTGADYNDIMSAFKVLQAYSLVLWQTDREAYDMHKLVHAWGHDRLQMEERRSWSLAVLDLLNDNISNQYHNDIQTKQRLIPHVMGAFRAFSLAHESLDLVESHNQSHIEHITDFLDELGRWDEEYELSTLLLQLNQKIHGPTHPATLAQMNDIGENLRSRGKYEQSETIHRQTLQLKRKVLGPEHPETILSLSNLAAALSQHGKYGEAETIHRQALQLQRKVLGAEHPDTIFNLNHLATALSQQGKYEESDILSEQALRLSETKLDPRHPYTLMCKYNLARRLDRQCMFQQAELVYRETFELRKEVFGPNHPDTLDIISGLARVLRSLSKTEQAETILRDAIRIRNQIQGSEHPSTLDDMNSLAAVLVEQGKDEQAETIFKQNFHIYEKTLGPKHPQTLRSMNNLGRVLQDQGKNEEARSLYTQALPFADESLGPNHLYTISIRDNLAKVLHDQGKYENTKKP